MLEMSAQWNGRVERAESKMSEGKSSGRIGRKAQAISNTVLYLVSRRVSRGPAGSLPFYTPKVRSCVWMYKRHRDVYRNWTRFLAHRSWRGTRGKTSALPPNSDAGEEKRSAYNELAQP